MQTLKITLLVLGGVILQITLIARASVLGSRPDLPLAMVVSVALLRGPLHGGLVGFASGLLCSGGQPLGVQSLSGVMVGYGTGFARGRLYPDNLITQSALGLGATLADKIIEAVHLSLVFADSQFFGIRFSGLILVAAINGALVVAVFWTLKRLLKYETHAGLNQQFLA